MLTLSNRQKRALARNGFVVDNAVNDCLIAEARGAVKGDQTIEIDENRNEPVGARATFCSINYRLFEYADDLIGGEKLKHPDDPNFGTYDDEQLRVYVRSAGNDRIDDPGASSDRKVGVHADVQTDGDGGLSVLNIGIYLDHVPPRNGGFTVWPGSHWMTAKHCEMGPANEDAEPGTRARARELQIRDDSPYESMSALLSEIEPFEITGDAGSVIFWHPGLIHSSGIHLQPGTLRMAAFSRFHARPGTWNPEDIHHPFTLWEGISDNLYSDIDTLSA